MIARISADVNAPVPPSVLRSARLTALPPPPSLSFCLLSGLVLFFKFFLLIILILLKLPRPLSDSVLFKEFLPDLVFQAAFDREF